MQNKTIISLIKEHMRIIQFLAALRKLGIEVYDFDPDLMSIIAQMMNVEDLTDDWMELYVNELVKCEEMSIEALGKNLEPLAESCYKVLRDFHES